jgi:glycosidase
MTHSNRLWQLILSTIILIGMLFPTPVLPVAAQTPAIRSFPVAQAIVSAAIAVDGVIDAVYGAPIAVDPAGDGNGNSNMDLLNLYAAQDATNFYFAFTINANINTTNWGKYAVYFDTTNDTNGAPTDAWGRAVTVSDPHKPEYALYTYVNELPYTIDRTQFYAYTGGGWGGQGTADAAAIGPGDTSVIEYRIAKSRLGNPSTLWMEVWDTGGGDSDNAQDTINSPADDWNPPTVNPWGTPAVLSNSTQYGAPLLDGVIDPVYGAPIASDPSGDGIGGNNLDMLDMYLTEDYTNLYFAFTVNDDLNASNWGKYVLYIDTTNNTAGATSDAWGRAVTVSDPHKPEYAIYTWLNATGFGEIQFFSWNGTAWANIGTVDGSSLGAGKTPSVIEWKAAKQKLGLPGQIWFEAWSSGGDGTNARDTINNPVDPWSPIPGDSHWNDPATLLNSTPYTVRYVPVLHAAHDNNIWWDQLGFDSRMALYRNPTGPVTTASSVILRMRAAAGDLTAAKLRVYNDRTNTEAMLDLTRVADDGTYEWWQVSLPVGADPTVYWYRFVAIDGTATAYYEDDASRDGGWGQVFAASADNSWQLTVYNPAFQTPDWVKNAVFYQVFPDRFRDGNPDNNTPAGTFFYNEAGGTVYRSNGTDWNTPICDPREAGTACTGSYSKNFYGGDLQGLIDKLPYLKDLGVTAIYLNPIFKSPSNHKYDTTDFGQVDPAFGTLATFQTLASQAKTNGMNIILDGVFNHSSSDSIYFDRYQRYVVDGACESLTSNYRTWYYFQPTGPCAGNTNYTSWFGYDSLPKLNSTTPAVRDYIWAGGPDAIARYWLSKGASGWRLDVAGDIDPGVTGDATNTYWEGFRTAVQKTNPNAYIVGEEWGNASSWLLGSEWDATMNYQYASAMMSFWRDTPFVDNDQNSSSSAGPLNPITPSQLDARLKNWIERYPPQALYAMLNLLDSHDTSRVLFKLDENASGNDRSIYLNPDYDWSDAIQRLKGVVMLQMTLPGAPTIYYGDEVGLVGPDVYSGGKWEDDPYNRQPFPWLDVAGVKPYYTRLQTQAGQDSLRNYYQALIALRKAQPALRTGSFDTLKVDNTNLVYSYGRRITGADGSAAVVVINRKNAAQDITLSVLGYVPTGTVLVDALTPANTYPVPPSGDITLPAVAARSGVVLVMQTPGLTPPAAPTNLKATEGDTQVTLEWDAVPGATTYYLYRSLLSGGGYQRVNSATDTGLINAQKYYYVVTAVNGDGLESGYSNEVMAIPHLNINWAGVTAPATITKPLNATPTEMIFGQVYIPGATSAPGQTASLTAQLGYGPQAAGPANWANWQWFDAAFNQNVGNNDEFQANLMPEQQGVYHYAYRFSTTGGRDWTYADRNGIFDPTAALPNPGVLTIAAPTDAQAPTAPTGLNMTDFGPALVALGWTAATDDQAVYAYDILRSSVSGSGYVKVGRVLAPTLSYTDSTVLSGNDYYYVVVALDTSFNPSPYSNEVKATPKAKVVTVTLNVTVPAYTPGDVYFTRYLDPANNNLGGWDPAATKLTRVGTSNVFSVNMSLLEGVKAEFKFARGTWDTVEKDAAGLEIANRTFTATYGTTGLQTIDLTVENWRDPIVTGYGPKTATVITAVKSIFVTWSKSMEPLVKFDVLDGTTPVPGNFVYDDTTLTVTFTPTHAFTGGKTYTINVTGQKSSGGDTQQAPVTWSFLYDMYHYYLPIISR